MCSLSKPYLSNLIEFRVRGYLRSMGTLNLSLYLTAHILHFLKNNLTSLLTSNDRAAPARHILEKQWSLPLPKCRKAKLTPATNYSEGREQLHHFQDLHPSETVVYF